MVNLIVGSSGTGKTRQLVEKVVDTARNSKGNVICIDKGKKLSLILPSDIRFIDIGDYKLNSSIAFYGFLIGLCAGDYDLTDVFIDSTMDILTGNTEVNDFLDIVSKLSDRTNVNFYFSICSDDDLVKTHYEFAS